MDANKILRSYFLKVALPIMIVTLIGENIMTPGSYLNKKLQKIVLVGSTQQFIHERGGIREERQRGRTYYDAINFDIYEGDAAKNLPLKEFMVKHVTSYEPAVFLGLIDDWPAISRWNETTLSDAFGDELVQALNYTSSTYSYFWKSTEIQYLEMGEVLDAMLSQRDYSKIYRTTRSSGTAGVQKLVVVDSELPDSLMAEISAPNVTEQLLDLNMTTIDVLGKGSKSVTQRFEKDLLSCVVSGGQEFAVVTAWEYTVMRIGTEFSNGGYLPIQYSPVDLIDDSGKFSDAKVHHVTLGPGDCLYIPAHWWIQRLSSPEERTVVVNHWYESSSTWADMIIGGISAGKL